MSSKLSNQTAAGRRTPLSLGSIAGPKTNQKSNTDSNPPDSTTIDLKHRKADDKSPNLEKTDSPGKNPSAKDATNNITENKKEKTSKKDLITSHENGHGDKEENLKKIEKKLSRESTRNKDVLKTDAKEINKETEKTKPEKEKDKRATPIEKKENLRKSNEEMQKDNKINKSDDEIKKNEVTKKKDDKTELKKITVEEVVTLKRASRASTLAQQTGTKQEPNVSGGSLGLQQEFQGFEENENDVEMESLLLDLDVPQSATTIPTAAKTISSQSPSIRSRIPIKSTNEDFKEKRLTPTPRRNVHARKEIEPTVITHKLSPPSKLPAVDVPVTSTPDGKTFYTLPPTSLRQISGRRSLRPLKEYTFQYNSNYRESYRHINTEHDCTNNTSMNVTVGSEIAPQTESFLSSFFSFGRGKKRVHTPPPTVSTTDEIQDDAVNTNTASPKRPRLDLSGLIGLVASPVTMLKNRLYRAKIDSSTPNNKTEDINDAELDLDGEDDVTDNVSEIISEEKKILLEEEQLNKSNANDTTAELDDEDDEGEEEEDESNDSIEKEKSIEHLSKIEIGDEGIVGSNEGIGNDVVIVNRRGRCDIM